MGPHLDYQTSDHQLEKNKNGEIKVSTQRLRIIFSITQATSSKLGFELRDYVYLLRFNKNKMSIGDWEDHRTRGLGLDRDMKF